MTQDPITCPVCAADEHAVLWSDRGWPECANCGLTAPSLVFAMLQRKPEVATYAEGEYPLSPEGLAAIKARAGAATPGPFAILEGDKHLAIGPYEVLDEDGEGRLDAAFIAHARGDVGRLVAEVETLWAIEADRSHHCETHCMALEAAQRDRLQEIDRLAAGAQQEYQDGDDLKAIRALCAQTR